MAKALLAVGVLAIVALTAIAVGQNISGTEDVKIVAKKLADGRIEFGLEQDGERILPRSRFFPADAPVDKWLKSSAVGVTSPPPDDWESRCYIATPNLISDNPLLFAHYYTESINAGEQNPNSIAWRCYAKAGYEALLALGPAPDRSVSQREFERELDEFKQAAYADDFADSKRIWPAFADE